MISNNVGFQIEHREGHKLLSISCDGLILRAQLTQDVATELARSLSQGWDLEERTDAIVQVSPLVMGMQPLKVT